MVAADIDLRVNLAGIELQNPVIPASGCWGFGFEYLDFYDPNVLGAASLKGTTWEPHAGNDTPRIAETTAGMINSIGLQNPGVHDLVEKKIPALREIYQQPIIANISGFSVDEYVQACQLTDGQAQVIELNISCPNVHGGGAAFGSSAALAAQVTQAVRQVVEHSKLFVKLSPNVTSVVEVARAVAAEGADGLTLVNTFYGMRIDRQTRQPVLARRVGGFCGPAIFPMALKIVDEVAHAVDLPIMGCGGVSSAEDITEMMLAGATAVQVGAASLADPQIVPEIIQVLPATLAQMGAKTAQEIIGAVRA